MKQLKKKKGFTLVELIVVIAIIAILAAVAVPTTMHFVEKANISKENQQMNSSAIIEGVFTQSSSTPFNMALTDGSDKSLTKVLSDEGAFNASQKSVVIVAAGTEEGGYTITYTITGKDYGGTVSATLSGTFKASQIFTGVEHPGNGGTYTYDGTNTAWS